MKRPYKNVRINFTMQLLLNVKNSKTDVMDNPYICINCTNSILYSLKTVSDCTKYPDDIKSYTHHEAIFLY